MVKKMMLLSICIPTYNRSKLLGELLDFLLRILNKRDKNNCIEIVISDNASNDDTEKVVEKYKRFYANLFYYKNKTNVLDKNYYLATQRASGKYVWILSDDDRITENAIDKILKVIERNYNLIVCNHSLWSFDFSTLIRKRYLPFDIDMEIKNHNNLMEKIGLKLGFISSVIFKKELFFKLPESEYDKFVEYGFPFLYAIYNGVIENCNAYIISEPIVCARGSQGIADMHWWYKTFVVGSALLFDDLCGKGYSKHAINISKNRVLIDYVMHDISSRRRNGATTKKVFSYLYPYYKRYICFWLVCLPLLFMPPSIIKLIKKYIKSIR